MYNLHKDNNFSFGMYNKKILIESRRGAYPHTASTKHAAGSAPLAALKKASPATPTICLFLV
jgi:hypothetical protein